MPKFIAVVMAASALVLASLVAEQATNLAPNPGFESGSAGVPTAWEKVGQDPAYANWPATPAHTGRYAIETGLKFIACGSGSFATESGTFQSDFIPVDPDTEYRYSAWFRPGASSDLPAGALLYALFYDSGFNPLTVVGSGFPPSNDWKFIQTLRESPSTAAYVRLVPSIALTGEECAVGTEIWLLYDDVAFEPGPLIPDACIGMTFDNSIVGTEGDDTLTGTGLRELIDGRGGNDTINGGAGNDCIVGGEGNDRLSGGSGNDKLLGEAGADTLKGDSGTDSAIGGGGRDSCDAESETSCES